MLYDKENIGKKTGQAKIKAKKLAEISQGGITRSQASLRLIPCDPNLQV